LPADVEYLFSSEKTGKRLTERALRHLIQKYIRLAGLEGFSAHDLRHRFGYVMARKRHCIGWNKSWDMTVWTPQ